MSKNIYNEFQVKELEKNPNILSVSDRSISYSPKFKIKAVKEYKSGKTLLKSSLNMDLISTQLENNSLTVA